MSDEHTKPTQRAIPRVDTDGRMPDTSDLLAAITKGFATVNANVELLREDHKLLKDEVSTINARVKKLEDDDKRPSAPPRTQSGTLRLAADAARTTLSEADTKLAKELAEVKVALSGEIEAVRTEMGTKFAYVDTVNVAQSRELASQTVTLNAVNTTTQLLVAEQTNIAKDTKKLTHWAHNPLVQLLAFSIAMALIGYLSMRAGLPAPSLPAAPH